VVAEGTDVLAHELRIEARPETVFTFLTDPDKMTLWKGDSAQLDARPGGVYRVQIGQAVVVGEFVELDPRAGWCSRGGGRGTTKSPLDRAPSR
jgi:uncharacterized protein YndB with AHSA1/START domain